MPGTESDQDVQLHSCDVFLTRGSSFVSRGIRFFTRRFGESRTEVNHVGIVVASGSLHSAIAVEALTKVKRHQLSCYAKKQSTAVAVYRPTNLTDDELEMIVAKAESYVGLDYGWFKIVTHLADWTLLGAYVFRRLTDDDKYPICSWLVANAYAAADKDFGCEPGAASPDDIWDYVTANPDKYTQVRDLKPIPE
jgi:hypothetical protein